jgi:DNA polymerase V
VQDRAAADARRLLRVLFVWIGQMPTGADAARLLKLRCQLAVIELQSLHGMGSVCASRYTVYMSSSELSAPVRVGHDSALEQAPVRASVAIGFGSPADDSGVTRLDLNDLLIKHSQATFLMRVAGGAMREAGIDDGDVVLVDRAVAPAHGHVVIAVVDDEFVCLRLFKQGTDIRLQATDSARQDIVPREDQELQVWGVVTNAIKTMPV